MSLKLHSGSITSRISNLWVIVPRNDRSISPNDYSRKSYEALAVCKFEGSGLREKGAGQAKDDAFPTGKVIR